MKAQACQTVNRICGSCFRGYQQGLYHAIVCLHSAAGLFRNIPIFINRPEGEEGHQPPDWIFVQALMDDLVNQINCEIHRADPVLLATYALWRLNWIHPFVNGNGRTARIVAYYILCLKFGGMLGGAPSLPELLRRDRNKEDDPYVTALKKADQGYKNKESNFLAPVHELVSRLLEEQTASAKI